MLIEVIKSAVSFGFYDILLPFLLYFILIFALLQKVRVFGEEKKNLNIGFAVSAALLVVMPHAIGAYQRFDPVTFILKGIPYFILLLVALVLWKMICQIFEIEADWKMLLSIIIIIDLILPESLLIPLLFPSVRLSFFSSYLPVIITIGVFIGALYFISASEDD
ncbi:hypothetical protein J4460_02450 [Candidatus Woesearchaeota archaeon]|nr:MAG: hypothetical protein QS99_C0004G0052 [archaeon GW2011_AR4]MBS3129510.1 hypothetical protein [Candidatus Woesearchaeota archaeon]HIH38891.1 hypothetical protein [Candidatus Woesearchaeota archaeon]HIH48297.1 hypothetical protein [Candidatus Woesearchaeota archaeon]HIJ03797.1 hypothetical protein [Candidatus Woesearchaeota archaeon]